jgi:hypothetical protein
VLADLVARVHSGAPDLLATYANYPTTEYLRVEGRTWPASTCSWTTRTPCALPAAPRRPHGPPAGGVRARRRRARTDPHRQGEELRAQLDVVDEVGCAGAAVFSLTDEWGVGGFPVEGWQFGLQDRLRAPRPAFAVAAGWAVRPLRALRASWPR